MKVRTGARAVPPCGCPNEASSLRSTPDPDHPGYAVLPQVFDEFDVEAEDGGGRYECMVSTLCGPSLLTLRPPNQASLPESSTEASTLLQWTPSNFGLCALIPPDLKMSNILIALPENPAPVVDEFLKALDPTKDDPSPIPAPVPATGQLNIRLTDFDLAHSVSNAPRHTFLIQPQALRAPEVVLGAPWGTPADIWNFGCLVFEMATSRSLFALEPHSAHDDHDQLARMAQLLGDFPPALIAASAPRVRAHFTKDGKLVRAERLPLEALMFHLLTSPEDRPPEVPELAMEEAALFVDFVSSMLRLQPEARATAADLLAHPWLHDALVQLTETWETLADEQEG
ncbi:hypothetical protein HETIRDRAFT_107906 [Heterobasidion irregulare TC 32-1]|uniref:non-specific serine/threonine protein kinase n=1 Tax=Heterobasidion irregulare (strain TC 32-1) TaxID=747525 RepID=W4JPT9_HETIT|nr:uncharacterized protein HETIRDRAFT_107906 [Heterobasidion irregulare TC 32-1]ETW75548.1 hypothetical protein HETIRDRAFT_107906 [Heterobasidion irregulare TC 32-1]